MTALTVLGVPTSAGAFAPGQERAPAALREAGLLTPWASAAWRCATSATRPCGAGAPTASDRARRTSTP